MPRTTTFPLRPAGELSGETAAPFTNEGMSTALALRENAGPPTWLPVPVTVKEWGDPAALSVTVTDAVRVPAAVGVNVTEIEQLPPAATLAPHLLFCAKSPLFVPVTAMLVIESAAAPGLLKVTPCPTLVVFKF